VGCHGIGDTPVEAHFDDATVAAGAGRAWRHVGKLVDSEALNHRVDEQLPHDPVDITRAKVPAQEGEIADLELVDRSNS